MNTVAFAELVERQRIMGRSVLHRASVAETCLVLSPDGAVSETLTADGVRKLRTSTDLIAGCYVLHNPFTERVKIGRSGDVLSRWRNLERESGVPLHPLIIWTTDDHVALEKQLHQHFAGCRAELGEWFHAAGVLPWFHAKRWEPFHAAFDPIDVTPEELAAFLEDYRARHTPVDDGW